MSLEFRKGFWDGDRNAHVLRLQMILNIMQLDKITEGVSRNGKQKSKA